MGFGKMTRFTVIAISVLVFVAFTEGVKKRDRNDYTKNPYRLVCYFGSWANYHVKETFKIENVDHEHCTHINYGFAKLDEYNYTMVPFDPYLDTDWEPWDLKAYKRFIDLRKKNPELTTMIAIGGWYEGSEKYSDMANDIKLRERFVKSVVELLLKYDFDGLDVDWEYPANRKGKPYDKDNYIHLMRELKEAFEPHGFLLTTALSPGKPTMDTAYGKTREEVKQLNDLVDWGNLMTYDYHGGWDDNLGHNAPIDRRPEETDDIHKWFNVNFTVHYYLEMGFEKEKMVMGMPFYGRAWTLESPLKVKLNDSVKGMSPPSFITTEEGVYGYNEICMMEKDSPSKWINKYDPYYRAPYAYNDKIWVGFDNQESLSCKVSYLKKMGLSGGMVWSLENDDFNNRCGGGVNPLLHRVHSMLNGDKKNSFECNLADIPTPEPTIGTTPKPTTTTQKPTTTSKPTTTQSITSKQTEESTTERRTESPTTTEVPITTLEPETASAFVTKEIGGHIFRCYKQGMFSHPTDRHKYVVCEYIASGSSKGWWIHIMGCAPGTRWHQPLHNCIVDEE